MVKYLNKKTKILVKKKSSKKELISIYFFGTLYSLVKKAKKIYLKLHFSYDLCFKIPKQLQFFVFKKRLVILGDKKYLKNFINSLIKLRIPNIYTGTGLREKNKNYIIKPGKIRKR